MAKRFGVFLCVRKVNMIGYNLKIMKPIEFKHQIKIYEQSGVPQIGIYLENQILKEIVKQSWQELICQQDEIHAQILKKV